MGLLTHSTDFYIYKKEGMISSLRLNTMSWRGNGKLYNHIHCKDVYSVYLCRKWVTCCDSGPVNVETFEKMCEMNLFMKMCKVCGNTTVKLLGGGAFLWMQHKVKVVHEYICIVELIQLFFAQVPCYVFDSDGRKHDLSPLIKLKDGYLVDDGEDSIDFYINICRSLSEYLKERKWLDSVIMRVFFCFVLCAQSRKGACLRALLLCFHVFPKSRSIPWRSIDGHYYNAAQ